MKEKNLNSYNAVRPVKQYFEWGTIKWLHEPEIGKGTLMVGHTTLLPNREQTKHLHTGDEQILYALSGKGVHWVDGEEYPITYGKVYHIPPYAEHAVKNLGDEPLEMIIVYHANSMDYEEILPPVEFSTRYAVDNLKNIIDVPMLQRVQDKFSEASQMSIVIKDEKGEIITEPSNPLAFCQLRCKYESSCHLNKKKTFYGGSETKVLNCCLDLAMVYTPIFVGDTCIGNIICGPVLLNEPSQEVIEALKKEMERDGNHQLLESYLSLRKLTKGRLYAIIESLKTMSHFIVETGIKNLAQKELHQKTIQVLEENKKKIQLEKALNEVKMEALQAQLSPHFLFNTLSVIGELAYMQGAKEAAETTFALSSLLRTTLKRSEELVKVREEIQYIKDYLLIQKKRFQHLIKEEIQIPDELMEIEVPFMTLQMLVENTIVHGLEITGEEVTIEIRGEKQQDYIAITVTDNGCGIKEEVMEKLFEKKTDTKEGTGIGLVNLKERFAYYYGDDYQFDIKSQQGKGTTVTIKLPIVREERDW
ncbi:Histidine kinase-, DNA gyrase B-, and HSP90-like ATPase [Natronincola peptidivorans]|uniref:histidine kinase n=1 Tax=Natronincola peptidivorans TaxID=426128 RepID=A0A1H9ZUW8_9FIRM|nr:PocR ligand-binding domain-containing protein [Natronincola peptidivorans]SES85562.1 Histidine kinase-, DNA gyrase B-, and HSP90-like ATPase [Natronincola peptidivorans]